MNVPSNELLAGTELQTSFEVLGREIPAFYFDRLGLHNYLPQANGPAKKYDDGVQKFCQAVDEKVADLHQLYRTLESTPDPPSVDDNAQHILNDLAPMIWRGPGYLGLEDDHEHHYPRQLDYANLHDKKMYTPISLQAALSLQSIFRIKGYTMHLLCSKWANDLRMKQSEGANTPLHTGSRRKPHPPIPSPFPGPSEDVDRYVSDDGPVRPKGKMRVIQTTRVSSMSITPRGIDVTGQPEAAASMTPFVLRAREDPSEVMNTLEEEDLDRSSHEMDTPDRGTRRYDILDLSNDDSEYHTSPPRRRPAQKKPTGQRASKAVPILRKGRKRNPDSDPSYRGNPNSVQGTAGGSRPRRNNPSEQPAGSASRIEGLPNVPNVQRAGNTLNQRSVMDGDVDTEGHEINDDNGDEAGIVNTTRTVVENSRAVSSAPMTRAKRPSPTELRPQTSQAKRVHLQVRETAGASSSAAASGAASLNDQVPSPATQSAPLPSPPRPAQPAKLSQPLQPSQLVFSYQARLREMEAREDLELLSTKFLSLVVAVNEPTTIQADPITSLVEKVLKAEDARLQQKWGPATARRLFQTRAWFKHAALVAEFRGKSGWSKDKLSWGVYLTTLELSQRAQMSNYLQHAALARARWLNDVVCENCTNETLVEGLAQVMEDVLGSLKRTASIEMWQQDFKKLTIEIMAWFPDDPVDWSGQWTANGG